MYRRKKTASKLKWVVPIILLSILCIGGMELLVCRFADPVLYAKISRTFTQRLAHLEQSVSTQLTTLTDNLFPVEPPPPEEPPDEQFAGSPAIWSELDTLDDQMTKLENRGEAEVLTGGATEVLYYHQGDPQWSALPYGTDSIGGYGCGPTAMAMVVSSLTDTTVTPAEMAVWAKDNGFWAKSRGSYLSIVQGAAKAYGLLAEPLPDLDPVRLKEELSAGKLAVALMSKGHFTQGGHFILLRGTTLSGGILVADPNSRERSLALWDTELIMDELSPSRNNGAPLWILSPASPFSDAD